MSARAVLAGILVLVPAIAVAQGRGHGGPPPRAHAGGAPAHAGARGAGPHGNSQGKAHDAQGKAHGKQGGTVHGRQSAAALIDARPELRAKLQQRLPAGTDINAAADGFGSLGQFVAAVNVSKNLDIPFNQLKSRVTGENAVSLGAAIQELRPDASGRSEARRAEREANELIGESR